jgi:hypothetical protein
MKQGGEIVPETAARPPIANAEMRALAADPNKIDGECARRAVELQAREKAASRLQD